MKKNYIFVLAAAAFMAAGCGQEIEQIDSASSYITKVFKAGIDYETKTSLEEGGKVSWSEGDVVRYYSVDNGTVGECSVEEAGETAELTVKVASSAGYLVAVYGGTAISGNTAEGLTITGAIPATQSGVFGASHVTAVKSTDITSGQLTFKNVASYIKFALSRDDVKKVVFRSNDGTALTGNGEVNIAFLESGITPSFGTGTSSAITVNNGGAGTFYIATLPCTMAYGFTADCYAEDGTYLGSASSANSTVVKSGTVLNLGTLDSHIVEGEYTDLSANGTANCYIVSKIGHYKFNASVKGGSKQAIGGTPAKAAVLWETFGTDETPAVGDVVIGASYSDGYVQFSSLRNGNAVIAIEDASGNILWSWHIWVCEGYVPAATNQVYNNNAGVMMDRNLGATSASKGEVGALGLMYQWGRKDPFLGSSSISSSEYAASTVTLPSAVVTSDAAHGTIEYAVANPTVFIGRKGSNMDWCYAEDDTCDDTRWTASSVDKGIYDPCPLGYRVPDGGEFGVWSTAFGDCDSWQPNDGWDATNRGIDFGSTSKTLGTGMIWYPATGYINLDKGYIAGVGEGGSCWSCTPYDQYVSMLSLGELTVHPDFQKYRAAGRALRCVKDASYIEPSADLSAKGTANSYIVSEAGTYRITVVKGNSSESVGEVASASVLWESLGKYGSESVSEGDLVKDVKYVNGYIFFTATSNRGNAVIAAKDSEGDILWSWHIWMTEKPVDQIYTDQDGNEVGTMMDRNLGATSAAVGKDLALGLMYQWGRKDPFLGAVYKDPSTTARPGSTISWPASVSSTEATGSIEYAVAHPTTFITSNNSNLDWNYTGSSSCDHDRWKPDSKTIYDPCPVGYRVPAGESDGIWAKALGTAWKTESNWNSSKYGMDLGQTDKKVGTGTYWYPAAGELVGNTTGKAFLNSVGANGLYWSATSSNRDFYCFKICNDGSIYPGTSYTCASNGQSVRCMKE